MMKRPWSEQAKKEKKGDRNETSPWGKGGGDVFDGPKMGGEKKRRSPWGDHQTGEL